MSNDRDEALITGLLQRMGENPNREGLLETPHRVLSAYDYLSLGYRIDPMSVLKTFEDGACDEMVFQGNIPLYSLCEHHMIPFFGIAHIAYIPNGRIVGLSKLARLVDVFSRRLQVQERLTNDVANALMQGLECKGVGVVLQCRHLCMEMRGVEKIGTVTTTSALRGNFKEHLEVRAEFMSFVTSSSVK